MYYYYFLKNKILFIIIHNKTKYKGFLFKTQITDMNRHFTQEAIGHKFYNRLHNNIH